MYVNCQNSKPNMKHDKIKINQFYSCSIAIYLLYVIYLKSLDIRDWLTKHKFCAKRDSLFYMDEQTRMCISWIGYSKPTDHLKSLKFTVISSTCTLKNKKKNQCLTNNHGANKNWRNYNHTIMCLINLIRKEVSSVSIHSWSKLNWFKNKPLLFKLTKHFFIETPAFLY